MCISNYSHREIWRKASEFRLVWISATTQSTLLGFPLFTSMTSTVHYSLHADFYQIFCSAPLNTLTSPNLSYTP